MNEQDFVALAKKIIAIPSTADKPAELHKALDIVRSLVKKVPGVTIEEFEQNNKPSFLAYIGDKRPKNFKILLNGHVDIVPGRPDQFKPYVEDGKLYGRGALDMKAAALALADVFCQTAPHVDYPLGLQIVSDEEVSGADGTLHQIQQGVDADFVIAGEFSRPGTICNESRGISWVKVDFQGVTAHSAYLWNGQNAILQAQTFISKLLESYPIPQEEVWRTTVNVASVTTSNKTLNRVPDDATAMFDIRYVANDPNFASEEKLHQFLQAIDPKAKISIDQFEPSHYADPNNPSLKRLVDVLGETTDQKIELIRKQGAADVRYYTAKGRTAIVYGLVGEGLHSDEEYLEISSIATYQKVLSRFIRNFEDNQPDGSAKRHGSSGSRAH